MIMTMIQLIKTYQTQSLLINNEVRTRFIADVNTNTSFYEAYLISRDFHLDAYAIKKMVSLTLAPKAERSGVRNLPPPCCVLEQDTLLPESTG